MGISTGGTVRSGLTTLSLNFRSEYGTNFCAWGFGTYEVDEEGY